MAAKTIKKLLKSLQNDLESAWKSVQRLRTLLESPKQRKTSKTPWFFIAAEPWNINPPGYIQARPGTKPV